MNLRPWLALGLALSAATAPVRAQTSPFVPEPLFRDLVNEISGDRAFEDVRSLSHFHRTGGSRDFFAASEWIRGAAEAAGLEDVKLIRQAWDGPSWSCASGEAWLLDPELKLASYAEVRVSIADNSRTTHLTAELVDVGNGLTEADYAGKDVKGKVVLASGGVRTVQEEAVWKRGALGILSFASSRLDLIDAPDQVAWGRLPYDAKGVEGVKDGTPTTFAVMISPRRGRSLQSRLAAAGKPLQVKVDIESSHVQPGEQAMVEAWIHGTEIHDQQIVLTAHIQEEMTSANDDGSGCASMLEIGRSLVRLIKDGKIRRPRRDIRFWWTNELASEPQYFHENPREPRRMLLDIQQDMVAARQSWGGRVQYAARSPWSLPSALDDVMESVLTLVRDGNTSLLNVWRTSVPQPFSREITSVKGTREPYHARMVPFFAHSDHKAFVAGRVGVAANALINWPDEFIHSTGDELDNIDATQLERNAVVVALVSLWFGGAGEEDAATLAAYTAAQGRARIAADAATAVARVAEATPEERDAAYRAGRNLVHQAHLREQAALLWIRRLAPKGRSAELAAGHAAKLEDDEGANLDLLERAFTSIAGRNPPNVELSKEERAMAEQVFVPVADLAAYDAAIDTVKKVEGLHDVMLFEIFNFADGRRTAFDVYEAAAAEAFAAGAWHYGTVRPPAVMEALQKAAKAGAFTVRSK